MRGVARRQLLSVLSTADEYWRWYLPALRACQELIKNRPIEAILSTSPPWVAHVIAGRLRRLFQVPWIADFRDPWAENDLLLHSPGWVRRLHARLESAAIREADAVICNTDQLRLRFQEKYPRLPASKFVTITNGFDELGESVEISPRTDGERRIVYVGSLDEQRRVDTFCQAVALLQDHGSSCVGPLRVQFVGEVSETVLAAAFQATPQLIHSKQIEFLPKVNWRRAQQIVREADLLLLFQGGHRVQIPAKLYEYLRTGKPILAVADPGALTELLTAIGGGLWADINDPKDIAEKLLAALQLPTLSQSEVQTRWGSQFHYSGLAAQLAAQVRQVARPSAAYLSTRAPQRPVEKLRSGKGLYPSGIPVPKEDNYLILHQFPDPGLERVWRECLARVEAPAHYNAPEFFLDPYFEGLKPFAVLAVEHENVVGVLTGVHNGRTVECGLPSRPQVCIAKTADGAAVAGALARGLLAEAGAADLISVYTWRHISLASLEPHGFRLRAFPGNVVVDLSLGPDELFKQMNRKRRNNIRFALRQGVEIRQATTAEDFEAIDQIYVSWCGRKRITSFGRKVRQAAFCSTQSNRLYLVARVGGKSVAVSIFRYYPGGMVEYAENYSLAEFQRLKPNDLLQWKAIEWAMAGGFTGYSLGSADAFHREFCGQITPIYRYRLDRTWLRGHDLEEALFDAGREALRRLPTPIELTIRKLFGKGYPRRPPEPAPRKPPEA
jgi:glycosyltransferase involved in cell wall biosynthesis